MLVSTSAIASPVMSVNAKGLGARPRKAAPVVHAQVISTYTPSNLAAPNSDASGVEGLKGVTARPFLVSSRGVSKGV